ncbi:MAG: hypothetical protein LBI72_10170 [Flavobacteriaceae bacterium]|jgi:hypothetical protein|nr:hypothetical protein [Flavobacteriaceae bacterium]
MRLVTGISPNVELAMENQRRLKHYRPYLNADNISIYTFQSPNEWCKNINYFVSQISTIYFEDIENSKYYKVDCYDDIKDTFADLNRGDTSLLNTVLEEEFLPVKNYIVQTSKMVFNQQKQEQPKKWNVYLASGTFMSGLVKKRTVTVTKIKELNHLYILDVSVDDPNKTISAKDLQTHECAEFIKEKVEGLR